MFLLRYLLTLFAVSASPVPAVPTTSALLNLTPVIEEVLSCGTDEVHNILRKEDQGYALKMDSLEAEWAGRPTDDRAKSAAAPPYVLPIVFHIVHENGAENIPDSDVLRSVDFLNQALENTDYYDPTTGVNTQIQVCLARRTPENDPTNGINRIVSPLTNLNSNDDRDLKDLSRWAPRDYINVWVVKEACGLNLGCGLAGYAYYPGAHGSDIDGIVMEARWLADDEADLTVLVHELGHYLGVRHTFDGGCENDDCLTDGDRVCDTPPDQSTVAVPCTGSANSCSTDTDSGPFTTDQDDMHINYMDYGYFRCYSAFTAGQRERMHFFLEGIRRSLTESKGCQEPCPALVTASFTGGDVTVNAGETINFVNTSSNATRYEWYRGNTLVSTVENPGVLFDEVGNFTIRLLAFPADTTLCDVVEVTQGVEVVCNLSISFRIPIPAPMLNDAVTFINNSSGGDESEWTVDGTAVSTDSDLDYTFTTSGIHRVCLTESTPFCEKQRCVNIFVPRPITDPGDPSMDTLGCNGRFSYSYLLPESQLPGLFTSVTVDGSNTYALAHQELKTFVLALDADGAILWQVELFQAESFSNPRNIFIDNSGMLAGIADSGQGFEVQSIAFRIDPADGTLLWAKEISLGNVISFHAITDSEQDDNYRIIGLARGSSQGPGGGFQLFLDRETGNFSLQAQRFTNAGSFIPRDIAEFSGATGSHFILAGEQSSDGQETVAVVRTDASGNVESARTVTSSINSGTTLGFSNTVLVGGPDSLLVGAIHTQPIAGSNYFVRLCKTGLDGTTSWTKDYLLPSDFADNLSIVQNEFGYLLLANLSQNALLIQVDPNGVTMWAKEFDDFYSTNRGQHPLTIQGNYILIGGGRSFNGRTIPTIIRLSKDGSISSSCTPTTDMDIAAQVIENTGADYQTGNTAVEFSSEDIGAEPSNFELTETLSCREDCPEEEETCVPPYVNTYGPEEPAPNLAPYEVNQHVRFGNNVLIAGREFGQQPFVAALGNNGDVLWTRSIFVPLAGSVRAMIIDAEGMLCGLGTAGASANGGLGTYAFRFNPITGDLLWLKYHRRQGRSFVLSELVHTPGENFLRAAGYREADALSAISNAMTARIDLATGDILTPPTTYVDPGETSFRAFGKHPFNNTYYALANIQQSAAGTPQLARLNADGSVIFNKQYDTPTIGQALDMVVKGTTVTMLCKRNGDGFVLVQTDSDGNQLWQKDYADGNIIHGITAVQDGFLVWLNRTADMQNTIIRLDDEGNIVWANRIPGAEYIGVENTFHVTTSSSAMTISTINGFSSLQETFAVIRADLSGVFDFGCRFLGEPIEIPVTGSETLIADITLNLGEASFFTEDLDLGEADLLLIRNCSGECPEPEVVPEICGNGLDDDGDGLADCDDPDLSNNCCCLDPPVVDFGRDRSYCGPEEISFSPAGSWERVMLTGERTGTIDNFEPGITYDFLLDAPGTYFLEVIDTCGKSSFDTIFLTPYPPLVLNLGPDRTVCANATVPLRAQSGFASYEWVDGSTEETFTTYNEGDFWVVVTDSCGGTQTDTVTITFEASTVIELGGELIICRGDTLTLRLNGFTEIQWSQSSFIDCFDCQEVRFAPTMDTLLLVSAKQSEGCFSSDSLRVRINTDFGNRDTVFLCQGDSISFGDQTVSGPGQYYDIITENLCPVVDTLDVFELRDTLISVSTTICAGDSVLVFGSFEQTPGTYTRLNTRANGCDSTNQVILTVNPTVITTETISICGGDSALVFGVFERTANLYAQTETGSNGCDSTHQITLEVNDLSAATVQVQPDCGGAGAGAGEVFVESNGLPVTILWSNNTATALNENLVAGEYSVTVTTADGCSVTSSLTISDALITSIAPATAPESCPGENDGTVFINDAPAGFLYSLNGGPQQTDPTFNNLAPGTYDLVAEDDNGCPQAFSLFVGAASNLQFELPPDQTINFGDSVTLAPTPLAPDEATTDWLTDGGVSCLSCTSITLRPEATLRVTAIAADSSGCTQTRTTRITVSKENLFYVPNGFSPNSDGVNDVFRLFPGPAVEGILSFAVYDRWGGQVFLRKNIDPEDALGHWDGGLENGQDPSVGLYIYFVEVLLFDGEVVSRAGEVLLMR